MQAGKGARALGSHVILTLARGSAAPEGGGLQDGEEAIVRAAEHVGRQQSNGSNGGFSGVSRRDPRTWRRRSRRGRATPPSSGRDARETATKYRIF